MMKKYNLVLLLFLVAICSCDNWEIHEDQSDSFIKNYDLHKANNGMGVCELNNGGYAFLGNTLTEYLGTEICLILTDAYGNSVQPAKFIGRSGYDRGYCIKSAPDGGFIILGSTQEFAGADLDVWLIKTNNLGDTLWTRSFEGKNNDGTKANANDEGYWFDLNSQGDITMVGYATVRQTFNSDDLTTKQIWIYDVNQNGDQVYGHSPKYEGGKTDVDEARYIQRIDDGYLIAGVSNYLSYASPASCAFLMRLNDNYQLDMPSEYPRGPGLINAEATGLAVVDDTTYILCGKTWDNTSGTTNVLLYQEYRVRTDNDKFYTDTSWTKTFVNTGNNWGTSLLVRNNRIHVLTTQSNNENTSNISILSTNMLGGEPQYSPIGGSSRMESRTLIFSADGGFVISGTNERDDEFSSMLMIKTKPGGKL